MYFHKFAMLTLVLAGTCSSVMAADGPPKEVKAEFHQNVFKRDRLVRELATLDSKAADAVAAGQKPIDMHSHQVEMQDQIDLLQLRLETMSIRWNMTIPNPPKPGTDSMNESVVTAQKVESVFQDGRVRTDDVLNDRCNHMLASIDCESFLRRSE